MSHWTIFDFFLLFCSKQKIWRNYFVYKTFTGKPKRARSPGISRRVDLLLSFLRLASTINDGVQKFRTNPYIYNYTISYPVLLFIVDFQRTYRWWRVILPLPIGILQHSIRSITPYEYTSEKEEIFQKGWQHTYIYHYNMLFISARVVSTNRCGTLHKH